MVTLAQVLAFLYPSRAITDYTVSDTGSGQFVSYWNEAAIGVQPNQAFIDATAISAPFLAWLVTHGGNATSTLRREAKEVLAFVQAKEVVLRAVGAVATDEINILRAWLTSFKAEVASTASLADLKARVASLPNTPARTLAQFKTAVEAKVDSGDVDT